MMRMMRRLLALAALAVTTSVATGAFADETVRETRVFYGQQVLATSYGGQALMIHGFFSESYFTLGVGAFSTLFGGCIVHAAHGRSAAAVASPFIQASPLLLAYLGYSIAGRRHEEDAAGFMLWVGSVAAPLLDAMALGWEAPRRAPATSLQVLPTFSRDRLGVALGGSF